MGDFVTGLASIMPDLVFIPFFVSITMIYFPPASGMNRAMRIVLLILVSPFCYMVAVRLVAQVLAQAIALADTGTSFYQAIMGTLVMKLASYLLPIPLFTWLYSKVTGAPLRICQFVYSAFIMMIMDAGLVAFDYCSAAIAMGAMAGVWWVVFRASIKTLFFKGAEERLRFYNFIAFGLVIFAVLVNLAPQLVGAEEAGIVDYLTIDLAIIGVFLYLLMLFIYKNMLSNIEQYRELEEGRRKLEAANKATIDLQEQMIMILADVVGEKSGESGTHLKRVSECVAIIGSEMGYSGEDLQKLRFASMMHDVGKLRIPDGILEKPGKLTDEEFEVMKQHTRLGKELIGLAPGEIMDEARAIALEHHERWDGEGYLEGLSDHQIAQASRITSVADVFDALVNVRCYKSAWTMQDAHDYVIGQAGKQFDPEVVAAFDRGYPRIEEMYARFASETCKPPHVDGQQG